nr:MAG TPA_asm: Type IIB DNA topoisomerase [Caudoviricetes sp.]
MMIPKKITVKYSGFDKRGLYYNHEIDFPTERDADLFILDIKMLMFGLQSYTKIITWEKRKE